MYALSYLALWSFTKFCPVASILAVNLRNDTSLRLAPHNGSDLTVGVYPNVHCTKDPNWFGPASFENPSYESMCQKAMDKAIDDLVSHGLDTEFEFLDRGATAQTTGPQIQLPRKYVAGKYRTLTPSTEMLRSTCSTSSISA